uniref:Uncharacterized protein n=1 Tax=Romanomermis culicivorax TaxID=13658 RepID=A0A915IAP0_ROMCU
MKELYNILGTICMQNNWQRAKDFGSKIVRRTNLTGGHIFVSIYWPMHYRLLAKKSSYAQSFICQSDPRFDSRVHCSLEYSEAEIIPKLCHSTVVIWLTNGFLSQNHNRLRFLDRLCLYSSVW